MAGLTDKVVIITGSSSGIGAQTAIEFAKVGAKVVLTARRRQKLAETAEECYKVGLDKTKVLIVTADITIDDDVKKIVQATVDTFGGIDVVVNNAGYGQPLDFMTSTADDLDDMYKVHLRAVYVLTKLAVPYLLERKGNVINMSSAYGLIPVHEALPYSVAKAAQNQFTKAIAIDLASKGVRVNAVCPGMIETDLISGKDDNETHKVREACAAIHPAKRIGKPEEVAKTIVFLASDDASFISGVCMPIDSGFHNTYWQLSTNNVRLLSTNGQ